MESRGQRRTFRLLDRPGNSLDIVRPITRLAAFELVEIKRDVALKVDRVSLADATGHREARDHGEAVDGDGHDQSAVIVGMITQQFDTPRRDAQRVGLGSKLSEEGVPGAGLQFARG